MLNVLRRLPGRAAIAGAMVAACAIPVACAALFAARSSGASPAPVALALALSIGLAALSVLIAAPIALGFALRTYHVAPSLYDRFIYRLLHALGGIPPIACAIAVLVPVLAAGGRPSVFWTCCAMVIALLPRLSTMFAQCMRDIPDRYYLSGVALGATGRQAMLSVVLKLAGRPMLSSVFACLRIAFDQFALLQIALGFAPGLAPASPMPLPNLLVSSFQGGDMATAAACALALLLASAALSTASAALDTSIA